MNIAENGRAEISASEQPPISNTGVEITKTAVVDWLSFTLPLVDSCEGVTTQENAGVAVGMAKMVWEHLTQDQSENAQKRERAAMGYTDALCLPGGGMVLFRPDRLDMGVHVSLPSGALAMLPYGPNELIGWVLAAGGRFSRLDVAIDTDKVHITTVKAAITGGDLVSRSEKREYYGSFTDDAFTCYIGSRTSDRFVRVYNKQAEQKLEADAIWTRCEVEFKGAQARLAADYIFQGVDLRSLVFSAIDFRDHTADTNVSRRPQLDWWAEWVGMVDRVSFAIAKTLADTAEKAYAWVVKQVAPTLSFLNQFIGPDSKWLAQLCNANMGRIPETRWRLLDAGGSWHEKPQPQRFVERIGLGALSDAGFGQGAIVAMAG